ncbi:hypothetical protein OFN56_35900, partial [Escherichia coli]|nr:hypothetical protein [Escherichia coli]
MEALTARPPGDPRVQLVALTDCVHNTGAARLYLSATNAEDARMRRMAEPRLAGGRQPAYVRAAAARLSAAALAAVRGALAPG